MNKKASDLFFKNVAMNWDEAVTWLRAQPDQAALVRACYFDDPLTDAARRFHENLEWRAVRDFLPASCGAALDVGGRAWYRILRPCR